MDGAGVPLPGAVDVVLANCVFQHHDKAWLCVLLAAAGSTLGCLVLYGIGYVGGEVFIERRMSAAKFNKIRHDFEQHPMLALGLPAVLPPPFPFKIFVLAAGAFEMRWLEFVAVIFGARLVRFGALATLTVIFGRQIIDLFNSMFRRHWLAVLLSAVVVAIFFLVLRRVRRPVTQEA
jgi:membrane protein YqaA with SNARE-associated domain